MPLHIAVGSIAPQNGFGGGVAYVGHHTTENWRDNWNADAIATGNGSWRAGFYAKFVHTPSEPIIVTHGPPQPGKLIRRSEGTYDFRPVCPGNLAEQNHFFWLRVRIRLRLARTYFGMTETIVGGNVVKPFSGLLNASLFGEMNGRFVDIRESNGQSSPSISQLYDETTAPGLTLSARNFSAWRRRKDSPRFRS